jgi:two-component system, cell cycle sensor histidine kinase and response regulator CckA
VSQDVGASNADSQADSPPPCRPGISLAAGWITAGYIALSLLWIFATDFAAEYLVHIPGLPMIKGSFFVLCTGGLLYMVLSRARRSLEASQAELATRELNFRSLIERAPVGAYIDTAGKFAYVNPEFARILGASRAEQLLGSSVLDSVDPEFRPRAAESRRSLTIERRALPAVRSRCIRLDGSRVEVEVSATPYDLGGPDSALVFVTDLTERAAHEQETRQLEQQVRHAQKMESMGRLAGGVAHDFNNLLTVINGYAQFLLSGLSPHDPMYGPIMEIHGAGERAVGITRQLLAFSRRDAIEPSVLDVNQAVREVESMLRRLVGESIRVTTTLSPEAGPVFTDATWLTQILLNLAVNARDAMPEGGDLTFETAAMTVDESWQQRNPAAHPGPVTCIAVRDTGCGMDAATIERIFEPFFTTKPAGKGTGLGLSIVYGIVRSSGGWIEVQSEPGRGTRIAIFLPVHSGPREEPAAAGTPPRIDGHEVVLLAEDDSTVRTFAKLALTRLGYRVIACQDGEDALKLSRNHDGPVDLLVSDVVMPGISGTALADEMLRIYPKIRVLLMSGYAAELHSQQLRADTGYTYLPKPFTAEDLGTAVRKALGEEERSNP